MFKLIVGVFLIVNGVQAEKPSGVVSYNQNMFQTEQTCKDFIATEDGAAFMSALSAAASASLGTVTLGYACLRTEDNTI
jgi:hypothetical protein